MRLRGALTTTYIDRSLFDYALTRYNNKYSAEPFPVLPFAHGPVPKAGQRVALTLALRLAPGRLPYLIFLVLCQLFYAISWGCSATCSWVCSKGSSTPCSPLAHGIVLPLVPYPSPGIFPLVPSRACSCSSQWHISLSLSLCLGIRAI